MNRTSRPVKTSENERRLICRLSKKYPSMTARHIGNVTGILLKASIDSAKRVLRNFRLVGRIAAKKPLLNKKQIQKWMHWCKYYSALSVIDWKNVIFSVESRINCHSLRRQYIRRQMHQQYESRFALKTVKYSIGSH